MGEINKDEAKFIKISSFLSFAIVLSVFYAFYMEPVAYVHLISEDSWGEYFTFVCYATALLLMAFAMVSNRSYVKPGFLLITFCFFLMAMEEISWGQRILGLQTPEAFGAINRQGETTLHNLVKINKFMRMLSIVILLWATALPALIKKYEPVGKLVEKLGIPVAARYLWPFFIIAVLFIVGRPFPRTVEVGETVLGFAFLAYALDTFQVARKGRVSSGVSFLVPVVCAGVFVCLMTGVFVKNWPNPTALRLRYCDFVADELPERGMDRQSKQILRHIFRHPELMTVEFLAKLETILEKQVVGAGGKELEDCVVDEFMKTNDIKFSVFQKRKAFNMRRSDVNEQRARVLSLIGIEYYRLRDFERAAGYFNGSQEYTADKSLMDKNNLYLSKLL